MPEESQTVSATASSLISREVDVLDRVLSLCGLPDRFRSEGAGGGVIHDDAAQSTLVAVLSARERIAGQWRMSELVAYASESERDSVLQAVKIAGLFEEQLHLISGDSSGAMDAGQLRAAMVEDLVADKRPCYVHSTFGNPPSRQADNVSDLASVCKDFGAWLHVDGGTIGALALDPTRREVNEGLRRVDSYCLDMLGLLNGVPDCSLFFIADRGPMVSAFSMASSDLSDAPLTVNVSDQTWRIATNTASNVERLWQAVLSETPP